MEGKSITVLVYDLRDLFIKDMVNGLKGVPKGVFINVGPRLCGVFCTLTWHRPCVLLVQLALIKGCRPAWSNLITKSPGAVFSNRRNIAV